MWGLLGSVGLPTPFESLGKLRKAVNFENQMELGSGESNECSSDCVQLLYTPVSKSGGWRTSRPPYWAGYAGRPWLLNS